MKLLNAYRAVVSHRQPQSVGIGSSGARGWLALLLNRRWRPAGRTCVAAGLALIVVGLLLCATHHLRIGESAKCPLLSALQHSPWTPAAPTTQWLVAVVHVTLVSPVRAETTLPRWVSRTAESRGPPSLLA